MAGLCSTTRAPSYSQYRKARTATRSSPAGESCSNRLKASRIAAATAGRKVVIHSLNLPRQRPCRQNQDATLLDVPDLLILVAISIIRIEDILWAAVIGDVRRGHEMDARHETRPLVMGEGSVQFVGELPTLHVQRLGHGRRLVVFVADALIGRF